MKITIKNILKYLTIFLFITLIVSRISVRYFNNLWTDEIEEIKHLTTVKHLIFEYLPAIPGGAPGHYLLVLPFNLLFPYNKFILGFPGLLSHIGVFFLIPAAVRKLKLVNEKGINIVTLIVRAGFVLDPTFIFQAMEVRPYSILPLLWIISLLVLSNIFSWKKSNLFGLFTGILTLIVIIIWHFYGSLMLTSILVYFFLTEKMLFKGKILQLFSILFSILFASPLILFFSKGSFKYDFDSFEMLKIAYLNWQSYIYIILFSLIILLGIKYNLIKYKLVYAFISLVASPIIIIFLLDIKNHYWFLLRQFAWTILPLYIIIGTLICSLNHIKRFEKYLK